MSCAQAGAASAAPSSRAASAPRRRRGCGFRIRSAPGRAPGPRAARGCAACAALSIWFKTSPFYGHRRRLPPHGIPARGAGRRAADLLAFARDNCIYREHGRGQYAGSGAPSEVCRMALRGKPAAFPGCPRNLLIRQLYLAVGARAADATRCVAVQRPRNRARTRSRQPHRDRGAVGESEFALGCEVAARQRSELRPRRVRQRQDTIALSRGCAGNLGTRPARRGNHPAERRSGPRSGELTAAMLPINTVIASNRRPRGLGPCCLRSF